MQSFRKGDTATPWCTVVGVIKDIKSDGLDQSGVPHIYRPMYQFPGPRSLSLGLTVRTSLSATSLEPLIRREIQTVDPGLPIFNVRTMNEVIDGSLSLRRFSAELVGVFAVVALLLASVGIYGLLAYMVGQRAQEIGVRMALGAQRNDILKLVLTQGALLAAVGVCVGLTLAAVAAPMIAALLYGIRAHDPIVFLAVPLILLGVSFAASYIPAESLKSTTEGHKVCKTCEAIAVDSSWPILSRFLTEVSNERTASSDRTAPDRIDPAAAQHSKVEPCPADFLSILDGIFGAVLS
jgi:hypothetical protein